MTVLKINRTVEYNFYFCHFKFYIFVKFWNNVYVAKKLIVLFSHLSIERNVLIYYKNKLLYQNFFMKQCDCVIFTKQVTSRKILRIYLNEILLNTTNTSHVCSHIIWWMFPEKGIFKRTWFANLCAAFISEY